MKWQRETAEVRAMKFTAAANSAQMEERSIYEVLFGRVLSPQPIGRHLFLLIGGATSSLFRLSGWWEDHRKYDGRTRRWDLSGVGTNERRVHPDDTRKISDSTRSREMNDDQETWSADRACLLVRLLRIDIPGCADKRNPRGERAVRSKHAFLPFSSSSPTFLHPCTLLHSFTQVG